MRKPRKGHERHKKITPIANISVTNLAICTHPQGEPDGSMDFNDIYIISNLMETDLSSVIKSPQALTGQHLQFFTFQILKGLR